MNHRTIGRLWLAVAIVGVGLVPTLSTRGLAPGPCPARAADTRRAIELPDVPVAQSTPPPASELSWVRTGGPPGGLGYDIRYNFDDPNTWYVTDNFAGVHISTDNGQTWQPSNSGIPPQAGPTGDAIPIFSLTVDPHNPQIVWVGTNPTGHIYRSTDGGRTWQRRDNGVTIDYAGGLTFRGFTVDPRSSDIVYAMGETSDPIIGFAPWGLGTGGVVYRTTDGGANWEELWDGGIPSSLCRYMWIDPRDPDVLYVSTGIFDRGAVGEGDPATDADPYGGLGVLKSTDGGESWRVLGEANGLELPYIGSLYMHPDNPDVLLAAAGHLVAGLTAEHWLSAGHSPAGVYRTADGGEHWTHVLEPPAERMTESFSAVEICPSNPDIVYAGSDLAIYRSEDAGQTWHEVAGGQQGWGPPGVMAGWPIDMQCDPRDPERVFSNNYNGGNFLSEDGGRTWKNASQGYTGAQLLSVAVDPQNAARVYAAGRSGLWRAGQGGASWSGMHYPPPHDPPISGLEWTAIAVDPSDSAHLLAGHAWPLIIESTDSGANWQLRWPLGETSVIGPASAIVFAPSNPMVVYAGVADSACLQKHEPCSGEGYGVLVSHDGGGSWTRAWDTNLGTTPVLDVSVDATNAQVVYAASDAGLFKTSDGGASWVKLSIAGVPEGTIIRTVAVSPADPKRVLAGVEGLGVYVSTNAGAAWQVAYAGLEPGGSLQDIVFDPSNPQVVYCSDHSSGVYRSSDGGQTWVKINEGLRMRATAGLSISSDGQHLYLATDGEGAFRLDVSGEPPSAPYAVYLPVIMKQTGPANGVTVHRDLQYASYELDGTDHSLLLDLYLPSQGTSEELPLLVFIHGGGWIEGSKDSCPGTTFAQRGYAMACVDYRLGRPEGCPPQFSFPAQIHDVKAAVRWLRMRADQYGLDPERFGAVGDSSGGHLAALLGTSSGVQHLEGTENPGASSAVQAVCDWFGPVDVAQGPVLFEEDPCQVSFSYLDDKYGGEETQYFYWTFAWGVFLGGSLTDPAVLERASLATPLAYVDAQDPPFLVIHGESDGMVPIAQSELLVEALNSAEVDVTFVRVPGWGHSYGGSGQEVDPLFLAPTLAFLDQHLKPQ